MLHGITNRSVINSKIQKKCVNVSLVVHTQLFHHLLNGPQEAPEHYTGVTKKKKQLESSAVIRLCACFVGEVYLTSSICSTPHNTSVYAEWKFDECTERRYSLHQNALQVLDMAGSPDIFVVLFFLDSLVSRYTILIQLVSITCWKTVPAFFSPQIIFGATNDPLPFLSALY